MREPLRPVLLNVTEVQKQDAKDKQKAKNSRKQKNVGMLSEFNQRQHPRTFTKMDKYLQTLVKGKIVEHGPKSKS